MGPPHFLERIANGNQCLGRNKECTQFCFRGRSHDKFNDLGNGEDSSIPFWHGSIFREKDVGSRTTVAFDFIVEACIRMRSNKQDAIIREYGTIVKELANIVIGTLGWSCLLRSNSTQSDKEFVVYCSSIVEKSTNKFLDTLFASFI